MTKPTSAPRYALATRAIHVGSEPSLSASSSVIPDLSLSTTYEQSSIGIHNGFEYSRSSNPNRLALERLLASLEGADALLEKRLREEGRFDGWQGGPASLSFSSGSAATATVVSGLAGIGGHVVSVSDVYGGTSRYFAVAEVQQNVATTFVEMSYSLEDGDSTKEQEDAAIVARVRAAIRPNTKVRSIIHLDSDFLASSLRVVDDLGRNSNEPNSPTRPHRAPRQHRSRIQNPLNNRQYLFLVLLPKSTRARSRRRRSFCYKVSQWSFGRIGRNDHFRRSEFIGAISISAECEWERTLSIRLLARHSIYQDLHPASETAWSVLRFSLVSGVDVEGAWIGLNGLQIATWLDTVGRAEGLVRDVFYPGLKRVDETGRQRRERELACTSTPSSFSSHSLSCTDEVRSGNQLAPEAKRWIVKSGYTIDGPQGFPSGGMVAFHIVSPHRSSQTESGTAERFLEGMSLFCLAESLGGVESLAELPLKMTVSLLRSLTSFVEVEAVDLVACGNSGRTKNSTWIGWGVG